MALSRFYFRIGIRILIVSIVRSERLDVLFLIKPCIDGPFDRTEE